MSRIALSTSGVDDNIGRRQATVNRATVRGKDDADTAGLSCSLTAVWLRFKFTS